MNHHFWFADLFVHKRLHFMDGYEIASSRGARICVAMKARGITKLSVLSMTIGVSESAICRWRKGAPITVANAIDLCSALSVSLDWLLLGRGNMDISASATHGAQPTSAGYQRLPAHLQDTLDTLIDALLDAS